jgi:hypothetical protein
MASESSPEKAVSHYIGAMTFIWLEVNDEPGPDSLRGVIERNAIAMLSNHEREWLDPPSERWLGHFSDRPFVRGSGLWNQRHVEKCHDPGFINHLEKLIDG